MAKEEMMPLPDYGELPPTVMEARAQAFYDLMSRRRSVRTFSDRPVSSVIIEACLRTAGSAPSGANKQPWHFVVVQDAIVKRAIRERAEAEERAFYERRAPEEWLEALAPLGTNAEKPFLETAPYLIVIFAQSYGEAEDGGRIRHYYVQESVGIATGILIAALHYAGLATLTHTPSPMGFLNDILGRPANERPFLIMVTGYPAENSLVPNISRKPLAEIASFL
ncbi:MAG: nitroreductase family protein [Candidatus Promineifilaceae bacterium]